MAHYGQTWCHSQNRKYITYCIVDRWWRPQVFTETTENFVKFGYYGLLDMRAERQTKTRTDTLMKKNRNFYLLYNVLSAEDISSQRRGFATSKRNIYVSFRRSKIRTRVLRRVYFPILFLKAASKSNKLCGVWLANSWQRLDRLE